MAPGVPYFPNVPGGLPASSKVSPGVFPHSTKCLQGSPFSKCFQGFRKRLHKELRGRGLFSLLSRFRALCAMSGGLYRKVNIKTGG
ncbi:unnamed protein product [Ixodes persulcatus]